MSNDLPGLAAAVGAQARYLASQSEALRDLLDAPDPPPGVDRDAALISARCTRARTRLQDAVKQLDAQAKTVRVNAGRTASVN